VTEAARLLAAQRRKATGLCPVCGREFEGLPRRRVCSHLCQMRHWRAKKKVAGKEG